MRVISQRYEEELESGNVVNVISMEEQSELIKSIELNIDQSIQVLIARKEVLICEVTSKIVQKHKYLALLWTAVYATASRK